MNSEHEKLKRMASENFNTVMNEDDLDIEDGTYCAKI